jgi:hypothetical protein
MKRIIDDDYEKWKLGDRVVPCDDPLGVTHIITFLAQCYLSHDGSPFGMSREMNYLRVTSDDEGEENE